MKEILITCPTELEIKPFIERLNAVSSLDNNGCYLFGEKRVEIQITGIGNTATSFHMGRLISLRSPLLCFQVGIAGSFDRNINLGELVQLKSDSFGYWGARDKNDLPLSVFEIGLLDENEFPFSEGKLINPAAALDHFRTVNAVTVNEATGSERTIQETIQCYPAEIETMESASFMYACLMGNWPFHCIRSISNYIELRDRSKWEIDKAVDNLADGLIEVIAEIS